MAALQGLTGLYADPQDTQDFMDEGVLEAKANVPDPEHGEYGAQHLGYQGTVPAQSPYSGMPVYDGYDPEAGGQYPGRAYQTTGQIADRTPDSHQAPYPRGIIQQSWADPDALARTGLQQVELHRPELGGSLYYNAYSPVGREEETHYTTDRYPAPNENYLSPEVPGQLRGSYGRSGGGYNSGTADVTQGYGVLNSEEEFQMGHSIRRVQHDHMPWDYTNLHGEQDVPFMGRHPVQQMPLDGPDSPYFDGGSIDGANIPWEGRIGNPSPYVQPAEPTMGSAPVSADVFAWS